MPDAVVAAALPAPSSSFHSFPVIGKRPRAAFVASVFAVIGRVAPAPARCTGCGRGCEGHQPHL
ncbi:hypothetical protein CRM91_14435 [Burkholderia ambifaria]|nr:hypothetical protein CRM91_14435 [Burkholderia ambifaria]